MAEDDRPDFDLFTLLQGPATMMNGMKGLADNGRKAISGLLDTISSLQRAAAALEQLAARVDRLVTDLEAPLRLLTPELERAANRVLRVAELVEGPVDRLLPGLEQAVETFERLSVNQLPDNLDALRSQVTTVIEVFAELPRKLGSLGGFGAVAQLFPGLERLTNAAARLVPGSSTEDGPRVTATQRRPTPPPAQSDSELLVKAAKPVKSPTPAKRATTKIVGKAASTRSPMKAEAKGKKGTVGSASTAKVKVATSVSAAALKPGRPNAKNKPR
jgi:hypothetical protein